MKTPRFRPLRTWTLLIPVLLFWASSFSEGAVLYKSYLVKHDRGEEILCDPYIVGENEAVLTLLGQKGEMAQDNFTEFLHLFKRLNPHVRDLNRVKAGEHIFIPIRKLSPGAFSDQTGGIVTIPFVTISKVKKLIREHSDTHRIERGDCISVLVARRFGAFGTEAYRLGVDLLQRANPGISDLNVVYVGQKIFLPRPTLLKEPWFPSLLDPSGAVMEAEAFTTLETVPAPLVSRRPAVGDTVAPSSPLARAAGLLEARLIRKGRYFFPVQGTADLELDLSSFPILETDDGKKVLLSETRLDDKVARAVRSFWEDSRTLMLPGGATLEEVLDGLAEVIPRIRPHENISFSDQGVDVTVKSRWMITRTGSGQNAARQTAVFSIGKGTSRIPETLVRFLLKRGIAVKQINGEDLSDSAPAEGPENAKAQPENPSPVIRIVHSGLRQVIPEITTALGFRFLPGVTLSFPYGGFHVKALTDLITGADGKMLVVDFEDLQGDAVKAISDAGIPVLQFKRDAETKGRLPLLFSALGRQFRENPAFQAGKTDVEAKVSLTFPGFLVLTEKGVSTLITHDGIDPDALAFLRETGIRVVTVPAEGGWV